MKEIVLKKREINIPDYVKRSALETDCSTLITEPCVLKNEAGEVIAIYDRLPSEVEALREGLKHVKYQTTERTGGLKTVSRIFGFMPRVTLRSDFCRMANLAQEMPEVNALLMKWGGGSRETVCRTRARTLYEARGTAREGAGNLPSSQDGVYQWNHQQEQPP